MVYSSQGHSALPADVVARVIGWARVSPSLTWKHPGLPREWAPVLFCPPDQPSRRALPGWVYLFHGGEVREVDERVLEVIRGAYRPG